MEKPQVALINIFLLRSNISGVFFRKIEFQKLNLRLSVFAGNRT